MSVTESLLCAYVSYLADQHLKHATIKVYLSAIRQLQIATGLPDPFAGTAWPRLDQMMKGIKRVEAEKGTVKRERLPISPLILSNSGALRTGTATLQDIFVLCLSSHISPNVCMADIKPSP